MVFGLDRPTAIMFRSISKKNLNIASISVDKTSAMCILVSNCLFLTSLPLLSSESMLLLGGCSSNLSPFPIVEYLTSSSDDLR